MKGARALQVFFALLLLACGFAMNPLESAAADKAAALTQSDCVKCHAGPPADIEAAGSKHKTDVSCMDCHSGHRPASKNNIPKCSQCHEGKPHYQLKACLECHKNPHRPLNIQLGQKVTEPCLTCHADQIKQLKGNPSKHTGLFCTSCHDVHRKIPECVKCHKPHSAEMAQADCKKCHKAHRPKAVEYGVDVANKDCGSCHKKALSVLAASQAKHKSVTCVRCHAEKHKSVPTCDKCHSQKHPAAIMKKFPKCGICHSKAHDLNHWADGPEAAKDKQAVKKTTSKKKK